MRGKSSADLRVDLFEELYSLSLEQGKAIDNADFDALASLIEHKQKVMNEIDLLNVQDVIDKTSHPTDVLKDLQKKIKIADENNRTKLIDMANALNEKINIIKAEKRQMRSLYMDIGDRGNKLDKRG